MVPAPAGVLEREHELHALHALLRSARDGRGRLLLLEAPPGLGKSTLLAHAAAVAASEGLLILRAAARELERELGWGVVRSLFEAWLLALPAEERDELLAGPAARARALLTPEPGGAGPGGGDAGFVLMHGLLWLTVHAAERRPLLVVVDDAQWADAPSLRFLHYLAGRLTDQPIALLVAARSNEPGADGLLATLISEPGASVYELAPLSREAVTALIRSRVAGADDAYCGRCFELTAGNPLFVRELARSAVADVASTAARAASSLQRLVLRRLASLPEEAQALARAVAVFEGGVQLEHAGALARLDGGGALRAADALAAADILAPGERLEFVHPLLRAAVYGTLGRYGRASVHARAAQLLLGQHAPAEQVGTHLLHAAPAGAPAAVGALRSAAAEAFAHGVPDSAIAYLERALREPPEADVRTQVVADLGRAELLAGRRAALDHFESAIRATAAPRERAALRLELARSLHDFGRLDEACAASELGLDDLGEVRTGDELALDLEAWWLTSAMLLPERARDVRDRTARILRDPPIASRAGRTLTSKALTTGVYEGGAPDAPAHDQLAVLARRLWADGRLLAEDGLGTQAVGHVGGMLSYCDDYDVAETVLEAARTRGRHEGYMTYVAASSQLLARQKLWTGPLADAVDDARIAFGIFAEGMQLYLPATGYCLARALLESGAADEADAILARVDQGPEPISMFAAWRAEAAGRLAAHRAEHEAALSAFLTCGERLRDVQLTNPGMFHWRSEAGLAAVRAGDRPLAERLIADELALAERFGAPRALGVARRAAGLLARGEDAVTLLRSAADLHAGCGARLARALSLTELGAAIRRAGRPGEARGVLREAIALADGLGAVPLAARAREQLRLAGGRPPAARDTAGDLTPSERRVADLAAAGRTNRQIADELFVTIKAVEWHLGNAYRKLDIRGRAGLGAALKRIDG